MSIIDLTVINAISRQKFFSFITFLYRILYGIYPLCGFHPGPASKNPTWLYKWVNNTELRTEVNSKNRTPFLNRGLSRNITKKRASPF